MSNSKSIVRRGLQLVRAENDPQNIAQLVGELNTAFATFKSNHNSELKAMRSEVDNLVMSAASLKTAGGGGHPGSDSLDGANVKVLRNAADFQAHYATKVDGNHSPVTIGEFMKGVAGLKTTDSAVSAMSIGTDTSGGYAVPDILMPRILSAMAPGSSLLSAGAGIVPMEYGAKSVTTAAIDTLPIAGWRLEKGGVVQSEPTFRAVVAKPKSLACMIKISRELLADGEDVDSALRFAIGQAFAKEFDRAGLRGSGTDPEPLGLRDTPGVNKINMGTNGAVANSFRDILRAYQAIIDQNGSSPTSAIMAPTTLVNFDGLSDTTGQPLRKPSLVEPLRFLHTSQIPTDLEVGTSENCTELYLGDFTGMHFLLRENLSIQLLREHYVETGELGFLCHARVDVVVPYPKAFAVIEGLRTSA